MDLIAIELRLSAGTNLPTVRLSANLTLQNDAARHAARLACAHGNLAPDAASRTYKLAEKHTSSFDATTNSKLGPFRHPTVDAREQLGNVRSELLLGLCGWAFDKHARVMPLTPIEPDLALSGFLSRQDSALVQSEWQGWLRLCAVRHLGCLTMIHERGEEGAEEGGSFRADEHGVGGAN